MNPKARRLTSRHGLRCVLAVAASLIVGPQVRAAGPASPAAAPAGDLKPYTQPIPDATVAMDMVPIPGGRFTMGSPEGEKGRGDGEGPQVEVEVEPFFMGKYEVTWSEYEPFLANYQRLGEIENRPRVPAERLADAVTYPTPFYEQDAAPILQRMGGKGGRFPAVIMSQFAARQYTKWLSKKTGRFYRLPTEAEWEYACRAATPTAFSFGDDVKQLDDFGWYYDNSLLEDEDPAYRPVGQKRPNPWGLYDMHGNVAELVMDAHAKDWYTRLAAKGGVVNWRDAINWPTEQHPRVVRGGGYQSDRQDCRSAWRYATSRNDNKRDPQEPKSPHWLSAGFWIGFRVVSPAAEPSEAEKLKFWNADDKLTRTTIYSRDRERHELIDMPAAPAAGK
jgi:formylglycine-generating enzyme required for sulfatase activity